MKSRKPKRTAKRYQHGLIQAAMSLNEATFLREHLLKLSKSSF